MTGRVKKIFAEKMFGFIRDDSGKEYFFHADDTDCWGELELGTVVGFEPTVTPKGPRAITVRLVV